jgi:ParB family chromosome partitioning protein
MAAAGAIVALGCDGEPRVERGFVRPEDDSGKSRKGTGEAGKAPAGPKPLSDKLVAELTAHRTGALRNELAANPQLALIAITHALALEAFHFFGENSCLEIAAKSLSLSRHAPGISEGRAARETAERHEAWRQRMPQEASGLWDFVSVLDEAERLGLLAHCAGLAVDAVQAPGRRGSAAHADRLAYALSLDMTRYWQATAESYFGRVSKNASLRPCARAYRRSPPTRFPA